MMKMRLKDEDLDNLMEEAIHSDRDYSIKRTNLIIVELLNRLLERKE